MKRYVIAVIIALLVSCLAYIAVRKLVIRSQGTLSSLLNRDYIAGIEDTPKGRALIYQKEMIDPILDNILAHPAHCQGLIDDENAFEALKGLDARAETPDKFLDFWNQKFLVKLIDNGSITPELERKIQEMTEGHITYIYPNKGTVEAIAKIWERYPCSEAAAISLLKIINILFKGYILSIQINGQMMMPYKLEVKELDDYIISNYPDSWQSQISILSQARMAGERYSLESIAAQKHWIDFIENHDVMNNKYYLYYSKRSHGDIVSVDYSIFVSLYSGRCKELALNSLVVNGRIDPNRKIPQEAIDMYNALIELKRKIKEKYPDQYQEGSHLSDCYELIKKYAPDQYHGDPPLVKDK